MFKHKHIQALQCMVAASLLFGTAACQQRCQAPATMAYKSMVDTQWRLVASTDPSVSKTLDNFNFIIMTFNRNNTGSVTRVADNDQYDTPVLTLVWAPAPQSNLVRIQYSTPAASSTGAGASSQTGSSGTGNQGTYDYSYTLSNELDMIDTKSGYSYRYVPFQGIVNPDQVCSF